MYLWKPVLLTQISLNSGVFDIASDDADVDVDIEHVNITIRSADSHMAIQHSIDT
jgi:hypothetical protein